MTTQKLTRLVYDYVEASENFEESPHWKLFMAAGAFRSASFDPLSDDFRVRRQELAYAIERFNEAQHRPTPMRILRDIGLALGAAPSTRAPLWDAHFRPPDHAELVLWEGKYYPWQSSFVNALDVYPTGDYVVTCCSSKDRHPDVFLRKNVWVSEVKSRGVL